MNQPKALDPRVLTSMRGFVVAGGQSSRMGRDKALLPYRESTLLGHAVATATAVTSDVRILCGPRRRYQDHGVPVVEDAICGVGPLGGLYSGLLSASIDGCQRIFWLGVDLPLVPSSLLSRLVEGLDQADVVMVRTPRGVEPLCAAFRTGPTIESVRAALLKGRLKLTAALEGISVQTLEAGDRVFVNVNSVAEYNDLSRGASPKE